MEGGDGTTQGATVVSFHVSGVLRGRPVSVEWLDPPGEPPGVRFVGDGELLAEIGLAIAGGETVAATPTGPTFVSATDPPHVALVTIVSVLDEDAETFVSGDVPSISGLDVPEGATP
jgi:hypothetical protein